MKLCQGIKLKKSAGNDYLLKNRQQTWKSWKTILLLQCKTKVESKQQDTGAQGFVRDSRQKSSQKAGKTCKVLSFLNLSFPEIYHWAKILHLRVLKID